MHACNNPNLAEEPPPYSVGVSKPGRAKERRIVAAVWCCNFQAAVSDRVADVGALVGSAQ